MFKRIKILVLYNKNGCCYWRSWLPHQTIKKEGLADVKFLELKVTTKAELAEASAWADIIQMVGLMDVNGLTMLRQYQQLGCKFSIDYDDLHFNCSPFNPNYKHFGTEDIDVKNPVTGEVISLWKDGIKGFNLKQNKLKFHTYKAILKEADIITCPTLYLKQALGEIRGRMDNIHVLPNAIDFSQWKSLDIRDKYEDKFRFGWAVSGSHGEDWLSAKPVLLEFLRSHPDSKFVCIGDTYMDIREGLKEVKDQIEWYPFSDLWDGHYQYRMPMLGLDVAIAPLADTEFNKCKSPLKWEEYTAFGWPVIAQNMTPYKEHIIHGETGLLAGSTEGWLECITKVYNDVQLRSKLRFKALLAVREMFDVDKIAQEWVDVYKSILYGEGVKRD